MSDMSSNTCTPEPEDKAVLALEAFVKFYRQQMIWADRARLSLALEDKIADYDACGDELKPWIWRERSSELYLEERLALSASRGGCGNHSLGYVSSCRYAPLTDGGVDRRQSSYKMRLECIAPNSTAGLRQRSAADTLQRARARMTLLKRVENMAETKILTCERLQRLLRRASEDNRAMARQRLEALHL
ncbi:hypothetical protein FISHEDRAFT_62257 [Fistulina hepatica ATCC 64428]|nr:hypothetical protein FISHEDRAFT_62257 [Fistulina hepatica ATCC 64428]